jgi:peptidoglycan hydrolase-like protein with peptidoglycan-binding domain
MSGPAGEPDVGPGDSGDTVTQLQTRLQVLGYYTGSVDGRFGAETTQAVHVLRAEVGLGEQDLVDPETWQALATAEERHSILTADPHGTTGGDLASGTPVGTVSEDQHWRWDGEQWQPNEEHGLPTDTPGGDAGGEHVSEDGHWRWDGNQWQPVQ